MLTLKIAEKQETNFEASITLKNKKNKLTFTCENSLLLKYYEHKSTVSQSSTVILALSHLFSQELIKLFHNALDGGVLEVDSVSPSFLVEPNLPYSDVVLEQNKDSSLTLFPVRIYAKEHTLNKINQNIIQKSVQSLLPKVTGYPALASQLSFDRIYQVSLLENIRVLGQRELFLKLGYFISNQKVYFYFQEKMVKHFCSLLFKKAPENKLPFNNLLGKIFSDIFLQYLQTNLHLFAKLISSEVTFVKDLELLELNMQSEDHSFEFFIHKENKVFLKNTLVNLNFIPKQIIKDTPKLTNTLIPFPAEVGVSYLNISEYKNLTEGDIIIFDKTCLSTDSQNNGKCVVNLNGIAFGAELTNNSIKITHFTKDW